MPVLGRKILVMVAVMVLIGVGHSFADPPIPHEAIPTVVSELIAIAKGIMFTLIGQSVVVLGFLVQGFIRLGELQSLVKTHTDEIRTLRDWKHEHVNRHTELLVGINGTTHP